MTPLVVILIAVTSFALYARNLVQPNVDAGSAAKPPPESDASGAASQEPYQHGGSAALKKRTTKYARLEQGEAAIAKAVAVAAGTKKSPRHRAKPKVAARTSSAVEAVELVVAEYHDGDVLPEGASGPRDAESDETPYHPSTRIERGGQTAPV